MSKAAGTIATGVALVLAIPMIIIALTVLDDEDAGSSAACGLGGIDASVAEQDDWPSEVAGFSEVQLLNAAAIMGAADDRGLDSHASAIGVTVAIVESNLLNLANAGEYQPEPDQRIMSWDDWDYWREAVKISTTYPNDGVAPGDWDSVGLFQGRPSAGWGGSGSLEQQIQNLLDPTYTAGRFFDALTAIEGWASMEPGAAAQAVQRSGFPSRYAERWDEAQAVVAGLAGVDLSALTASCSPHEYAGIVSDAGWVLPLDTDYRLTSRFGEISAIRGGVPHAGLDFAAPLGTAIYAVNDGVVVHSSCDYWEGRSPCNLLVDHGLDQAGHRIQSLYVHMFPDGVLVSVGDQVQAGDPIALVGLNGNTTGPHLHLEVWVDGSAVDPEAALADVGLTP